MIWAGTHALAPFAHPVLKNLQEACACVRRAAGAAPQPLTNTGYRHTPLDIPAPLHPHDSQHTEYLVRAPQPEPLQIYVRRVRSLTLTPQSQAQIASHTLRFAALLSQLARPLLLSLSFCPLPRRSAMPPSLSIGAGVIRTHRTGDRGSPARTPAHLATQHGPCRPTLTRGGWAGRPPARRPRPSRHAGALDDPLRRLLLLLLSHHHCYAAPAAAARACARATAAAAGAA